MKCNDQLLVQEIERAPSEPESKILLRHVSECPRCQQRMFELAASDGWWKQASIVLQASAEDSLSAGSIVITIESSSEQPLALEETASMDMVDVDEVALGYLAPPSHPEMLGRLGRYEIERLIGAGGMGIVFKGFDTELHRVVALKVLAPHLANSGAARRRFAREAQAAAAVVHENVIPIHNVEAGDKLPYLVMQYVPGSSLQTRVDQDGPSSVDEALRIGAQIADGLAAAHQQGLIHRDVKPANILLDQGVDRVLISDFGLARAVDDASLTRSGIVAGTPHYMSPEQCHGSGIDCRSDLFGLGSVLYFMCTGHPPFRADGAMAVLNRICHDPHRPVCQTNQDVPLELSCLIDRLLAKNPDRRIASAEQVSRELAALLTEWRTPDGRRFLRRTGRSARMRRQRGIAAAMIVLCFVAFLGVYRWWKSPGIAETSPTHIVPSQFEPLDNVGGQFAVPSAFSSQTFDQELRDIDAALRLLEVPTSASTLSAPSLTGSSLVGESWSKEFTEINHQANVIDLGQTTDNLQLRLQTLGEDHDR